MTITCKPINVEIDNVYIGDTLGTTSIEGHVYEYVQVSNIRILTSISQYSVPILVVIIFHDFSKSQKVVKDDSTRPKNKKV